MNLSVAFITSAFYNTDKPEVGKGYINKRKVPDLDKFGNFDFFLFTNDPNIEKTKRWDIVYLTNEFVDEKCKLDSKHERINVYRSRYPKWQGWKYLKDYMNKEYDVIFYVDMQKKFDNKTINWIDIADKIKKHEFGLCQKKHPGRKCIYEEAKAIKKRMKCNEKEYNKILKFLKEKKVPNNLISVCPITENDIFGYDPNNMKTTNTFDEFFELYCTQIIHRDQPLWWYILWKNKIKPIMIDLPRNKY